VTVVDIVEVGPRDGLQNESRALPAQVRAELVERLVGAGLRRIEACSFVNPRRVPQMADAEQVMQAVPRAAGVSYLGLVLNERGYHRAVACGVDEINVVVVATDTFSRRNQGVDTAAAIDAWLAISEWARRDGVIATVTIAAAFGCPFEGDVPEERIVDIGRRVSAGHPAEISLADTIGVAVPAQVERLFAAVRETNAEVALRAHFHNTRNTGYANAIAALGAGVTRLDASVGGIGGCPFAPQATGNIATEDLAWMLSRSGYEPSVDLAGLISTRVWIEEQLGTSAPATQGRVDPFPRATPERG
jgi:hydroxymethylglutaryl-CoA lyase